MKVHTSAGDGEEGGLGFDSVQDLLKAQYPTLVSVIYTRIYHIYIYMHRYIRVDGSRLVTAPAAIRFNPIVAQQMHTRRGVSYLELKAYPLVAVSIGHSRS